jgi:exopolyphosphatase/pppGpp-phosphohydrolase
VVCDRALREGLIVDWMLRNDLLGDRFAFQSTIRERTVRHLARIYGVDQARADRVAALALSLYDQSHGLLHQDDGSGRLLLWAAAQLHACGRHINSAAYHKHTWYLIRHGELLGYSELEHLMVAAIARYHRRGLPKKRHESWQLIEGREEKRCVANLALLLRLAVALDPRPAAVIERLSLEAVGPRSEPSGLRITLHPLERGPDQPALQRAPAQVADRPERLSWRRADAAADQIGTAGHHLEALAQRKQAGALQQPLEQDLPIRPAHLHPAGFATGQQHHPRRYGRRGRAARGCRRRLGRRRL